MNKVIGAILIILIAIGFTLIWYAIVIGIPEIEEPETCEVCEEDLPEVDIYTSSWGENYYDPLQLTFDYIIYNYGNSEIKNLSVTCKVFDVKRNVLLSETNLFGNVASNSLVYGVSDTSNYVYSDTDLLIPASIDEDVSGVCLVESCENCEILWKNIPELIELYN